MGTKNSQNKTAVLWGQQLSVVRLEVGASAPHQTARGVTSSGRARRSSGVAVFGAGLRVKPHQAWTDRADVTHVGT